MAELSKPLNELSNNLSELDWDYEEGPFIVSASQILEVLKRYISGEVSDKEIEDWANLIECREDIIFEKEKKDKLEDTIYRLANPTLEGVITPDSCEEIISKLIG